MKQASSVPRAGKAGKDPRVSTYELQKEIYETVNNASTTLTLVNASKRLVDELPEGTPAPDVINHWLKRAREADADRGLQRPDTTAAQPVKAGGPWRVGLQLDHL